MDKNMKVSFSVDLTNAILEYLSKQPYFEVFMLISQIQKEANDSVSHDTDHHTCE